MHTGDIVNRQYGVRVVYGAVVIDGELEIRKDDGGYRYIYGAYRDGSLSLFVSCESLFDALEEREISPIFGIPMPLYDMMVESFPTEERYASLEEATESLYYSWLQQLSQILEAKSMDGCDDDEEDEETVDGLLNRPDFFLYEEEEPFDSDLEED